MNKPIVGKRNVQKKQEKKKAPPLLLQEGSTHGIAQRNLSKGRKLTNRARATPAPKNRLCSPSPQEPISKMSRRKTHMGSLHRTTQLLQKLQ
jgi:hypothetical protein